MAGRNRFNNIDSKEWLPFQKSWFIFDDNKSLYESNLRFFIKKDHKEVAPLGYFYGTSKNLEACREVAEKNDFKVLDVNNIQSETKVQFALFDLRDDVKLIRNEEEAKDYIDKILPLIKNIANNIFHRRFLAILIPNIYINEKTIPIAWHLSEKISEFLSLKDEKIGCYPDKEEKQINPNFFQAKNNFFYCQYFRNDENSGIDYGLYTGSNYYKKLIQEKSDYQFEHPLGSWHIIKPVRRNKTEILHPAKYPEEIVSLFLPYFSDRGDNVFDPMSGTASTQLAALMMERNGYGTELSPFFANLASERLENFINPPQLTMFEKDNSHLKYKILLKDARDITKNDFPKIDYIITSPPYWDMLNMQGAENQAKRKERGLKTNYSENDLDLGNISDYRDFLENLIDIYRNMLKILKPGGFFTIIIKNIKKKGKNYPFAYDLGHLLQDDLILLPEVFWLQDDINLAPYGYGNTFVSNTFHQYCLTFQKPH